MTQRIKGETTTYCGYRSEVDTHQWRNQVRSFRGNVHGWPGATDWGNRGRVIRVLVRQNRHS